MEQLRAVTVLIVVLGGVTVAGVAFSGVFFDGPDPDGDELIERALEGDADPKTVHGTATSEYIGPNETVETTSEVWLRPADEYYRIEITASDDSRERADVVAANGSLAWFYHEDAGEVYRYDLEEVGLVSTHDRGYYERLVATFDATFVETDTVAGREAYVVRLTPPEEAPSIGVLVGETEYRIPLSDSADDMVVDAHYVWLDTEYLYPLQERTELEGADGTTAATTTTFESITFDEDVSADRFEFEPPADAEVIDATRTEIDTYETVAKAVDVTELPLPTVDDLAVPDRFEFRSVSVLENDGETFASLVFEADSEQFSVTVSERHHDFDRGVERTVDGREARIVHRPTGPALQWNCDGYGHQVFGLYDEDELVAVAESVDCGR